MALVKPQAPPFVTGTRLSFQQTAAPTGWTKDVTAAIDNSALRLVTGSVVNGGSVAFSTAFASQAVTGSNGASAAYTLAIADIPSHDHKITPNGTGSGIQTGYVQNYSYSGPSSSLGTISNVNGVYPMGGGGAHSHGAASFTGNAINLAVKYYDFIIATKS